MANISRLKAGEISDGNTIYAADLEAELDQLVNSYNSNDTILSALVGGAYTMPGPITFTNNPLTNGISERSSGSGVTIDSVRCKDGMVKVAGTPTEAGEIGYASNVLKYHNGSGVVNVASAIDDLSDVTITSPSQGQSLVYNGSTWVNGAIPYIKLQDQKASGTAGGTFTSGAKRTHDLNTEVTDTHNLCTLAGNVFTIPAGTWYFEAYAIANQVQQTALYLENTSDATTVAQSLNGYADSGGNVTNISKVSGQFTIAGTKNFELQQRCSLTRATDGFGLANSFGGVEIYAQVELWKVG